MQITKFLLLILTTLFILAFSKVEKYENKKLLIISVIINILVGMFIVNSTYDLINVINYLIVLFLLVISSMLDISRRLIPIEYFIVAPVIFLINTFFTINNFILIDFLITMAIVVFLLVVGRFTKGMFGYGDIFIVVMMTLILSYQYMLSILLLSLVFSSILGLLLILLKKANRKTGLPFAPIVLFGFVFFVVVSTL